VNRLYWLISKPFLVEFTYKVNNLLQLAGLVFYTFVFYFLGGIVDKAGLPAVKAYGGNYFSFVLFGLAFSMFFSTAQTTFSSNLRNEQILGTLEALQATGTNLYTVLLGYSVYDFLQAVFRITAIFAAGILFLGVHISWANFWAALLIFFISIFAFAGFGLISAAFVMAYKKGDPFGWIVANLSLVLGGVYYPVEVLPVWMQKMSAFLPITHALKAVRLVLLKGVSLSEVMYEIYILIAFIAVLLPVSVLFFRWALKKAVFEGTLAGH
jgi:ABC-2 type transport system permease protein